MARFIAHKTGRRGMRKLVLAVISLVILALAAPDARALASTATWTLVASLPIGTGAGEVAYDSTPGDIAHGPQALSVGPSGEVYLLDSVNRRIHVIVQGSVQRTIDLPGAVYPREISALPQGIFVLDVPDRILHLDVNGSLIAARRMPAGVSVARVLRVGGAAGMPALWTGTTEELPLAALPAQVDLDARKGVGRNGIAGPDGRRWLADGFGGGGTLHTVDGRTSAAITVRSYLGEARLVGFDAAAQPYLAVDDVSSSGSAIVVEQTIRRFDANGAQSGIARIPWESFAISPRRAVEVMPDGTLYVMVPAADRVSVYHVSMGTTVASRLPATAARAATPGGRAGMASPLADVLRDRKTTNTRAIRNTEVNWVWHNTYDKYSNGASRGTNTPKPAQLSVTDGSGVVGVPYDWGGFDSPAYADGAGSHSDSQPWTQFDGATGAVNYYYPNNGPLMGNTNGSGNYVGGTAGIDCAGFVYSASGYISNPKKGTGSLMTGGSLAGLDAGWAGNVQSMNYFASLSHTFFYDYRRYYDLSGFNTLEATTDQSQTTMQGAKRNFRTWTDAGNYQHKSWWAFGQGDTWANPFTSSLNNSATWGVHGQNVWYKFFSSASAVTLTGISGGDPDIWVYYDNGSNPPSTLVGPGSVNAGTANESVSLPGAGWYYADVHIDSTNGGTVSWTIGW